MHHFVRYNAKTSEICGSFRCSSKEFVPKPLSTDEKNLEITDPKQIELARSYNPRTARLAGSVDAGQIRSLKSVPIFRGRIEISCDAPDRDGDGLPELPADDTGIARVSARLLNNDGKRIDSDGMRVRFSTTRGTLSARGAETRNGTAQVELRATTETVKARLSAQSEGFEGGTLIFEFIPPDEYRALAVRGKVKEK